MWTIVVLPLNQSKEPESLQEVFIMMAFLQKSTQVVGEEQWHNSSFELKKNASYHFTNCSRKFKI